MQALVTFLKDRLFGEGNVVRHLASKGYRVEYEQDPRKEFDFSVTNIAVDLRSGLRICKLVEVLTGEKPQILPPCIVVISRVVQPERGKLLTSDKSLLLCGSLMSGPGPSAICWKCRQIMIPRDRLIVLPPCVIQSMVDSR